MSHNPHWNAAGRRRWSAEDDATMMVMKRAGKSNHEIAKALTGTVQRSVASIKSRIRYLSIPEQQRKDESRARHRAPTIRMKIEHITERAPEVPQEVWADRNRRLMAESQRSLTGRLCGDPIPGTSALERRA